MTEFQFTESLLGESEWLQALARSLVSGLADAEDVAQDVLVAAIGRQAAKALALRPWLATVARYVASNQRRGDRRRTRREAAVAKDDATESTAEVVARAEIQARVAQAVVALDPLQRDAILLRYWEGLPPRECAERLGVPVETVRTRIKRGLAKLRRELDAMHGGDRQVWMLALVPLVGLDPSDLAPVEAVIASGAGAKTFGVLAAVLVVLATAIGVLMLGDGDVSAVPAERVGMASDEPATRTNDADLVERDEVDDRPIEPAPEPAPDASALIAEVLEAWEIEDVWAFAERAAGFDTELLLSALEQSYDMDLPRRLRLWNPGREAREALLLALEKRVGTSDAIDRILARPEARLAAPVASFVGSRATADQLIEFLSSGQRTFVMEHAPFETLRAIPADAFDVPREFPSSPGVPPVPTADFGVLAWQIAHGDAAATARVLRGRVSPHVRELIERADPIDLGSASIERVRAQGEGAVKNTLVRLASVRGPSADLAAELIAVLGDPQSTPYDRELSSLDKLRWVHLLAPKVEGMSEMRQSWGARLAQSIRFAVVDRFDRKVEFQDIRIDPRGLDEAAACQALVGGMPFEAPWMVPMLRLGALLGRSIGGDSRHDMVDEVLEIAMQLDAIEPGTDDRAVETLLYTTSYFSLATREREIEVWQHVAAKRPGVLRNLMRRFALIRPADQGRVVPLYWSGFDIDDASDSSRESALELALSWDPSAELVADRVRKLTSGPGRHWHETVGVALPMRAKHGLDSEVGAIEWFQEVMQHGSRRAISDAIDGLEDGFDAALGEEDAEGATRVLAQLPSLDDPRLDRSARRQLKHMAKELRERVKKGTGRR